MSDKANQEIVDDVELFERLAANESKRNETASLDVTDFLHQLTGIRESQGSFEFASASSSNILHIELESRLVGERLVLTAPPDIPLPFTLKGDTIILGDYYISVRWKGEHNATHNETS